MSGKLPQDMSALDDSARLGARSRRESRGSAPVAPSSGGIQKLVGLRSASGAFASTGASPKPARAGSW